MPRIDAHHHFWHYTPAEYGWIDDSMAVLRRDFGPAELAEELRATGIEGVVTVQARQTLAETRWLLELAAVHPFIRGVVGWVPLTDPGVGALLAELVARPGLRGVRHVLQGEPDDGYMLRADFNRGLGQLRRFGLVYDLLIFERHLPTAVELVTRHPDQAFVLDHIAKPRIRDGQLEPWARNLRELARRPNVYCKVSGLVTEADLRGWTGEQLRPYFDTVLAAFGPDRLMFGSDWPVCLAACGYARWHALVRDWAAGLAATEQESLFGGTAAAVYSL